MSLSAAYLARRPVPCPGVARAGECVPAKVKKALLGNVDCRNIFWEHTKGGNTRALLGACVRYRKGSFTGMAKRARGSCRPDVSVERNIADGSDIIRNQRGGRMRRREFITLLGGAVAWPLAARAQQSGKTYRIGLLMSSNPSRYQEGLIEGLRDLGYIEGKNIIVERRHPGRNIERLPELARELVRLGVDIIAAGGTPAVVAARDASDTIPVVMATAGDPVATGIVQNLARPGGRITGLTNENPDLGTKRMELLREIIPTASRVRVLSHPNDPLSIALLKQARIGAQAFGLELDLVEVRNDAELQAVLARLSGPEPVEVLPLAFLLSRRRELADALLRKRIVAIYGFREHVDEGGLMSYGPRLYDNYYRAASYIDRILRGARPADLPVEQPVRFELVLNLKTAKALGIEMPSSLLARADEVIE